MDIGWMAEWCHVIHSIGDSDGPLPYAPLHIRRTELGTNLRTSFRSLHISPKLVNLISPARYHSGDYVIYTKTARDIFFNIGDIPGKRVCDLPYAFELVMGKSGSVRFITTFG